MAGDWWLMRSRAAVLALAWSTALASGCGGQAHECVPRALGRGEPAPGEVFLTSCPSGAGRYTILGAGLRSGETIDLVFDARPLDPIAINTAAARADHGGRLRVTVRAPEGAAFVRLYGSRGAFAAAPLVPRPPPQGR